MNTGARRLDVRGWAICYHLWHPPASRASLPANDQLLETAQAQKAAWCDTGLSAHLPKAQTDSSARSVSIQHSAFFLLHCLSGGCEVALRSH